MLRHRLSVCLGLLLGLWLTAALAAARAADFRVSYVWADTMIYNGGNYDFEVTTDLPAGASVSYQWQVRINSTWYDLEDNDKYSGTQTSHMTLKTGLEGGQELGTGWEEWGWSCLVTSGKVKVRSPEYRMIVWSTESMYNNLKQLGYGIESVAVEGASPVGETDGVARYAAAAGDKLTFRPVVTDLTKPRDSTFAQSEMRFTLETIVTEGGKSAALGPDGAFTPTTVGDGTAAVEFRARLWIADHDLGIYQTRKIVLDVAAPPIAGTAITKQAVPVYREMYTQSPQLDSIGKNEIIYLVEDCGQWWKVLYKDRLGYVPTTALTVQKEITHVDVTIDEPVAGQRGARTIRTGADTYSLFRGDGVDWLDRTADRFLEETDVFVAGHVYEAVIWLASADGYAFHLENEVPRLTAALNGKAAAVGKAYEQYPGDVVELRYAFPALTNAHVCRLVYVPAVPASCTKSGVREHYRCTDCGALYADAGQVRPIPDADALTIPAAGHTPSPLPIYKTITPAACEANGVHEEIIACLVCGETLSTKTVVDAATGHDFGAWTVTQPPTETRGGIQSRTCARCGAVETAAVPALGHTHTLVAVAAQEITCTTGGLRAHYRCSGCGALFSDAAGQVPTDAAALSLPAAGHKPGAAVRKNEIPAACLVTGSYDEIVSCTVCGATLSTQHVTVPPTGHRWGEWSLSKPPTETETGVETRVCQNDAAHTETRAVAALGHAADTDPPQTQPPVTAPAETAPPQTEAAQTNLPETEPGSQSGIIDMQRISNVLLITVCVLGGGAAVILIVLLASRKKKK